MNVITLSPTDCAREMRADETRFGGVPFDALETLAKYYAESSGAADEPLDFDPVGWSCDWAWYEKGDGYLIPDHDYLLDENDDEDDESREENLIKELRGRTTVLDTETGYWIRAF